MVMCLIYLCLLNWFGLPLQCQARKKIDFFLSNFCGVSIVSSVNVMFAYVSNRYLSQIKAIWFLQSLIKYALLVGLLTMQMLTVQAASVRASLQPVLNFSVIRLILAFTWTIYRKWLFHHGFKFIIMYIEVLI